MQVDERNSVSVTDTDEMIYVLREPPVATIVLNRPSKRNALSLAMWERLPKLVREAGRDPDIRVIVLRGSEPEAFAAGADISEFESKRLRPADAERYNEITADAEASLAEAELPTIAMVGGYCVGGGCEIAVACDIRFCDTSARFGLTPARLGIVYSAGAVKRLVDLVGVGAAKYLLFGGELIGAEEAERAGLVSRVCTPDTLERETYGFARVISTRSLAAVRGMKRVISLVSGSVSDEGLREASGIVRSSFSHPDYAEGVRAFLEHREARFL
jgi:enoyl-CoA hydratase